ncbi:MAG: DUF4286 family protein, partial [Flavisolibacter sp.]
IYNVTNKVEPSIANEWLQWMLNEHIPDIMETKCFYSSRLVKILEIDESEGPTYAIQYFAASRSDYNRYIEIYADTMRKKAFDKWGDKFFAFRSVMEIVK